MLNRQRNVYMCIWKLPLIFFFYVQFPCIYNGRTSNYLYTVGASLAIRRRTNAVHSGDLPASGRQAGTRTDRGEVNWGVLTEVLVRFMSVYIRRRVMQELKVGSRIPTHTHILLLYLYVQQLQVFQIFIIRTIKVLENFVLFASLSVQDFFYFEFVI